LGTGRVGHAPTVGFSGLRLLGLLSCYYGWHGGYWGNHVGYYGGVPMDSDTMAAVSMVADGRWTLHVQYCSVACRGGVHNTYVAMKVSIIMSSTMRALTGPVE